VVIDKSLHLYVCYSSDQKIFFPNFWIGSPMGSYYQKFVIVGLILTDFTLHLLCIFKNVIVMLSAL